MVLILGFPLQWCIHGSIPRLEQLLLFLVTKEQTENLKTKILTFVCLLSPNQAPFYTLHY